MQNYIQKGDAIDVPAPAGGVLSGQVVAYGKIAGIAAMNALQGASYALWLVGMFTVPKLATQAWAIGDEIYWDAADGVATNVSAAGYVPLGHATATVGAAATVGPVRLARLSG